MSAACKARVPSIALTGEAPDVPPGVSAAGHRVLNDTLEEPLVRGLRLLALVPASLIDQEGQENEELKGGGEIKPGSGVGARALTVAKQRPPMIVMHH